MPKKAQVQMMETVIILFIFFVLLVFGFVFYARFFSGSVKMEQTETVQLQAIQIAQRAADLPEIQCTKNNVRVDNCVDKYKLEAAKDIMVSPSNAIHYFDMFGFSKITINQIHPEGQADNVIYNKPPNVKKTTSSIFIPTVIYDPAVSGQYCYIGQGSCSLGLIEVSVYS